MGTLIDEQMPCPMCPSSDAYYTYEEDDGNIVGHCYSCNKTNKVSGDYVPADHHARWKRCRTWRSMNRDTVAQLLGELWNCHVFVLC